MTRQRMWAAAVAVGCMAAGGCCCGLYPDGGCGLGGGPLAPDCACGLGAACTCDSGACDTGAGCATCGLGGCVEAPLHGFLWHARLAIGNMLTCGAGCGGLYIDEWCSDPPDACDPCVDCAEINTPPCSCSARNSVPLNFWGRRFYDPGCSTCGGGAPVGYSEPIQSEPAYSQPVYSEPVYSEPVYSEPAVQGNGNSCPGGCGVLSSRRGGVLSGQGLFSGTLAHRHGRMPAGARPYSNRSIQLSQHVQPLAR
jgi:hypothetical protein